MQMTQRDREHLIALITSVMATDHQLPKRTRARTLVEHWETCAETRADDPAPPAPGFDQAAAVGREILADLAGLRKRVAAVETAADDSARAAARAARASADALLRIARRIESDRGDPDVDDLAAVVAVTARAVVEYLVAVVAAPAPDPLGEALNAGDGSYRP